MPEPPPVAPARVFQRKPCGRKAKSHYVSWWRDAGHRGPVTTTAVRHSCSESLPLSGKGVLLDALSLNYFNMKFWKICKHLVSPISLNNEKHEVILSFQQLGVTSELGKNVSKVGEEERPLSTFPRQYIARILATYLDKHFSKVNIPIVTRRGPVIRICRLRGSCTKAGLFSLTQTQSAMARGRERRKQDRGDTLQCLLTVFPGEWRPNPELMELCFKCGGKEGRKGEAVLFSSC
ncbi:Hypothetical predicted protein [Lynx pardinus]|uniref:Uncharacterized protein n=1 Tax=Lynx pardinus TaxID=191816 RepID=A0A485NW56_LYNPA|nr:Hypothetical predicted protein [Lynx pardinus]